MIHQYGTTLYSTNPWVSKTSPFELVLDLEVKETKYLTEYIQNLNRNEASLN